MSYADQSRRNNPTSIAVVVGIHALIGYALISGLAYDVISQIRKPTIIVTVPDPTPPPPIKHEPIKRQAKPTSVQPAQLDPIIKPIDIDSPIEVPTLPQPPIADPVAGDGTDRAIEPPRPSLARGPIPAANRNSWIGTDDYPSGALRQGIEGVVVLSAMISADGKVRSCLVTQSSGSQLLDDTTCRLYTSRARFTPARDADGNPIAAQRSDRFRWRIPAE